MIKWKDLKRMRMSKCMNHGFWCEASGCKMQEQLELPGISDTQRLNEALQKIGPNARKALVLIAERMAKGALLYGEDFTTPREWRKEASEELLDGTIYLAIEAVSK